MSFFAGFDTDMCPGLDTLAWLKKATGATWVGFYLGPAPSHPAADWMPHRADLVAMEYGLAPIFVGQQIQGPGSHDINAAQGDFDGATAARLMSSAGFPEGSRCFLDLEDGPPLAGQRVSYVKAWAAGISEGGYAPGFYCSHAIAEELARIVPDALLWAFKVPTTARHPIGEIGFPTPDPREASPSAVMWQREQNATIETPHGAVTVDVSSAAMPDPSAPH